MTIYAIMDGSSPAPDTPTTCVRVESRDDEPPYPNWLDVSQVTPMPLEGWTFDGTNWTQPAAQAAVDQAAASMETLVGQAADWRIQIQADAALFAGTQPGSTLTREHLAALQRVVSGFLVIQEALIVQGILGGVVPPLTTLPTAPGDPAQS